MMQAKAFYSLASALVLLSWMPAGVLGVAINRDTIQSRQAPTPGQVITGGQATFFFQGGAAGACGQVHADSDLIVALPQALFSSSLCSQQVQITNTQNQQTVTATVADECPSCNAQSLDLSQGAFEQIGDLSAGVLSIQWTLQ